MRDDVKNLIAKIEGDDASARENAILDLMYRMEDSTRHMAKSDVFDDKYFSQDEQSELIHVLIELAESLREDYATLLWVVSKANRTIMIDPVQNFVLKHANTMPSHMLRQCLVGLQNCMLMKDSSDYEKIKEKFKYEQLKAKLRDIKVQADLSDVLPDTLWIMETFYTQ